MLSSSPTLSLRYSLTFCFILIEGWGYNCSLLLETVQNFNEILGLFNMKPTLLKQRPLPVKDKKRMYVPAWNISWKWTQFQFQSKVSQIGSSASGLNDSHAAHVRESSYWILHRVSIQGACAVCVFLSLEKARLCFGVFFKWKELINTIKTRIKKSARTESDFK